MNPYIIVGIILLAYFALLIFLWRSGLARRWNISFMGPLVMLRTERGRGALRRIAKYRRFWLAFGSISRVMFLVGMTAMVLLLLWESTLVFSIPKQALPAPQTYLLIPGVNPFVPIGYGLLAIIVAVVLHEFAHGILSEAQKMDVKYMGVLMFVVPVGAFVEPDQQQLERAEPRKRVKVFGVGPGTNMVIALACLLLFLGPVMGSVAPMHDGLVVVSVAGNSSASIAGISPWGEIISINGTNMTSGGDFLNIQNLQPGSEYPVVYLQNGHYLTRNVQAGVAVTGVISGSPAASAGIESGWVVMNMNNTTVYNEAGLESVFNTTRPGQNVPFIFEASNGTLIHRNITLSSEKAVEGVAGQRNIGFLGIYTAYMGLSAVPVGSVLGILKNPFYGAAGPSTYITSGLQFLVLPFAGLSPVPGGLTSILTAGGVQGGGALFWLTANSLYWLFWINLWVGLFNMLPALPLDGGYLFKDNIKLFLDRAAKGRTEEGREKMAKGITNIFSLLVLVLIVWQLIGPRLIYL